MSKIRRATLSIAAVVAFSSLATAGFAASPSDAEKRAACRSDVMRYCFSMIGNDGKIEGCLRGHRPQLSGTCKALFDKYDPVPGQTSNPAGRAPTASEPPVIQNAPTVAQPANEKQPATPGSPADMAQTPPVIAPSTNEMQTPPVIAPSTNQMTVRARPCDNPGCSRLPASMEKMMRNMPGSLPKGMRDLPRAMAKAFGRF